MEKIEYIFKNKPGQWGLRGDPYMWEELKNSFSGFNKNLNQTEFDEELENRFNRIIEQKGNRAIKEVVWFESFPQFGMSGGVISLKWWREIGLPLIKNKYKEFNYE